MHLAPVPYRFTRRYAFQKSIISPDYTVREGGKVFSFTDAAHRYSAIFRKFIPETQKR